MAIEAVGSRSSIPQVTSQAPAPQRSVAGPGATAQAGSAPVGAADGGGAQAADGQAAAAQAQGKGALLNVSA